MEAECGSACPLLLEGLAGSTVPFVHGSWLSSRSSMAEHRSSIRPSPSPYQPVSSIRPSTSRHGMAHQYTAERRSAHSYQSGCIIEIASRDIGVASLKHILQVYFTYVPTADVLVVWSNYFASTARNPHSIVPYKYTYIPLVCCGVHRIIPSMHIGQGITNIWPNPQRR